MAKEALSKIYPGLIFRETLRDEITVRANGGEPTDVDFSNGIGEFNGSSSKVNYDLGLNGTYSVRIICNPTSFANLRFLMDCRGTTNNGAGYIYLNITTGNIISSDGTSYANGELTSTINVGVSNEIIITGITLIQGTGNNLSLIGSSLASIYQFLGSIDLVEIYNRTLTASEIKNLYC